MMGFLTVNRRLLPVKLHYAIFNAGVVNVQPTMPVYAKVFKFSSFIVGIIYTVLPLTGLIIKPLFGAIADKNKWHRGVNLFWVVLTLISFFVVQFVPKPDFSSLENKASFIKNLSVCTSQQETQPHYFLAKGENCVWRCQQTQELCSFWNLTSLCASINQDVSQESYCQSLPVTPSIQVSKQFCDVASPQGLLKDANDDAFDDATTFSLWQFWVFLLLLITSWGGIAVVSTLTDTICIEISGDSRLYGRQRVWGSIGWGVFAVINGFVIDAYSEDGEEKNYTPAFYLMLVPLLIDIVVSYFLKVNIPEQSKSIVKDVWKVLLTPRTIIFMFWCIMMGASLGLLWNFLFWLLEDLATEQGDEVNSKIKTIEGLVTGIQTFLGEAPAFFLGDKFLHKLGYGHTMTVILAIIGLRFTAYSFLTNPWYCIPVEILQSDYGLFYTTMTSYGKKISVPGTEATIQSVLCSLVEGVGVAVGSFLGGYFYDSYGGNEAFRIFGIAFFVMTIVNEAVEFLLKKTEHSSNNLLEGDSNLQSSPDP